MTGASYDVSESVAEYALPWLVHDRGVYRVGRDADFAARGGVNGLVAAGGRRSIFRIARRGQLAERASQIDARALARRVGVRQQRRGRHFHEFRIADVGFAVAEREIERFGDRVHVVGRVVSELAEIAAFDDFQRFEQRDALAPDVACSALHSRDS